MHKEGSDHGKESLDGYIELCTNKKERILQPRNQNAFPSCNAISFHSTEGLLLKRNTANI
jgi:alpha-D-ribose 1-methylphosphonate 5-triphosphate diphosphatase PhnM